MVGVLSPREFDDFSAAPLLVPLVAYILGILLQNPSPTVTFFLFLLLLFVQIFRRKSRMVLVIIVLAMCGFFRARHCEEAPIPEAFGRRKYDMIIQLDRCTLKDFQNTRRINGFATLVQLQGGKGPFGQQIYYNLELGNELKAPHRGQRLSVRAALHRTEDDPSTFGRYLFATGVRHRIDRGNALQIVSESALSKVLSKIFARSVAALSEGWTADSPAEHIYGAMLLGDRSRLSSSEKDTYSRVGIAHLFAVSGLHIGIIATFLHVLTRGLPLPRLCLYILRLLLLSTFVAMVGASPSSIRAFFMVTAFWSASLFFRRSNGLSSLVLAAFLTLILRPNDLYATGFQFSYGVVFAILTYGVPLGQVLRKRLLKAPPLFTVTLPQRRWMRKLLADGWELCALSISATVPLIPLSLYHFQTFSIGGIFLNPLVIPIASVAILCGFASICFGLLHFSLGCHFFNFIAMPFLHVIRNSAVTIDSLPWIQSTDMQIGFSCALIWTAALCIALHHCHALPNGLLKFLLPIAVAVLPVVFII
ncbi:MAG: ComEC/Rec2 family competence protein [Puniceicoccales bacterium]|jgi:competence protein ComEC|nr:ComEC/Rec2 family competence protein [Puniceicoccales bacterium]